MPFCCQSVYLFFFFFFFLFEWRSSGSGYTSSRTQLMLHCFSLAHTFMRSHNLEINSQFNLNCWTDLIILTIKLSLYLCRFFEKAFIVFVCVNTFVVCRWCCCKLVFFFFILLSSSHFAYIVSRCKISQSILMGQQQQQKMSSNFFFFVRQAITNDVSSSICYRKIKIDS